MIPLRIRPLNNIAQRNCRVRWAERRLASPSIRTRKGIIPSIHMRLTFCSSEHITIFWPNPHSLTLPVIISHANHPFQSITPQTRFTHIFYSSPHKESYQSIKNQENPRTQIQKNSWFRSLPFPGKVELPKNDDSANGRRNRSSWRCFHSL